METVQPEPRRTLLDRLSPESFITETVEKEGFIPGAMSIDTVIFIGWKDWFRLLISRRASVKFRIMTDVNVSRVAVQSVFCVLQPTFKKPKGERT